MRKSNGGPSLDGETFLTAKSSPQIMNEVFPATYLENVWQKIAH